MAIRPTIPLHRLPDPFSLTEYGDYSCLPCQELHQFLAAALLRFGDVRYTFRHFPNPTHPPALLMALAAEAARRQGHFLAMHRALFAHRGAVSTDTMTTLSESLGLDIGQFRADLSDVRLLDIIREDRVMGQLVGVVTTPTLFLGTRRLHGKLTQARLVPLMGHYMARARTPHTQVPITRNDYY